MPTTPPESVLARFGPILGGLRWSPVSGGLSGARVWRGCDPSGRPQIALKAWPTATTEARLRAIHELMTRAAALPYVPRLLTPPVGASVVAVEGRVWDATTWRPGVPIVPLRGEALARACAALARLHAVWPRTRIGPCPGVRNRLQALGDFTNCFTRSPVFPPSTSAELSVVLRRAWWVVRESSESVTAVLRRWERVPFPLGPCLRDCRVGHVLFEAGEVSGIIDYGAVAEDFAGVDLARLLGDEPGGSGSEPDGPHDARRGGTEARKAQTAGADDERVRMATEAYRSAGGGEVPAEFVEDLMRTAGVCSLVGWLLRWQSGALADLDVAAVVGRLTGLLERVEGAEAVSSGI